MRVYIHEEKGIPEHHMIVELNTREQAELPSQEIWDSWASEVPHTIVAAVSPFGCVPYLIGWHKFFRQQILCFNNMRKFGWHWDR